MKESFNRREFIKIFGAATSTFALQGLRPSLIFAQSPVAASAKIRHAIFLVSDGGYDGHSLMPYTGERQDIMIMRRPTVHVPKSSVLELNPALGIGLHPNFTTLKTLHDTEGTIKILSGIGTSSPSQSHNDAQNYYSTGLRAALPGDRSGWLARTCTAFGFEPKQAWGLRVANRLDFQAKSKSLGVQISSTLSQYAYLPRNAAWTAGTSNLSEAEFSRTIMTSLQGLRVNESSLDEDFSSALKRMDDQHSYIQSIAAHSTVGNYPNYNDTNHPNYVFYRNEAAIIDAFKDAARIITDRVTSGNTSPAIILIPWTGFDTHAGQNGTLTQKTITLNDTLAAFIENLKALGAWDQSVIYNYTEFNRTLSENGALNSLGAGTGGGTDHSISNNHFLLGGKVRGGAAVLSGTLPTVEFLNARRVNRDSNQNGWINNGIPYSLDYRNVLHEILGALGLDADLVFTEDFPKESLGLFV